MHVIQGRSEYNTDSFSNRIISKLKSCIDDDDAIAYYMFPVYRGDIDEDNVTAKILLISSKYGLFYFDKVDQDENVQKAEDRVNHLYNLVTGKFLQVDQLRKGRTFKYEIITVFISDDQLDVSDLFLCSNLNNLPNIIRDNKFEISKEHFDLIQSCVDGSVRMTKKVQRPCSSRRRTKGSVLNEIQSHIARFDEEQKNAALSELDSPQRIRGLAGSGKTIILTQKAALYHLNHKDDTILYTYYTKSLHDSIKDHIDRAYKYFSGNREPNWDKIIICHAWGGQNIPGVYSLACQSVNAAPLNLSQAYAVDRHDPFGGICKQLISNYAVEPLYDLILIDEGQDFTPPFYQLCYKLSKNKRIVWAYDDFQNIFDIDIQNERETFGKTDGVYNVDFSNSSVLHSDIVLSKCYRTPRVALIAAFSLGLGIYNSRVLQRLSSNELWKSLGFEVAKGNCQSGDEMIVTRPEVNTPSYSNSEFKVGSVKWRYFKDIYDECAWIASQVASDVTVEDLLPTDICIICLDRKSVKTYFDLISSLLDNKGLNCFNHLNTPNENISFVSEGCVTLSTINKAKGNEAAAVYVCGTDHIFANPNNVVLRDSLFTAMTRTKGWLTLTGCSDAFVQCKNELEALVNNKLELHFIQPSEEETKTIEGNSRQENKAIDSIDKNVEVLKKLGKSDEEILKEVQRLLGIKNE